MDGLLCINILGVLNVEPQKVTQLGCSVNLSLPGILSLSHHRCRHQLISILATDQIRSFEKDRSSVGER